MKNIDFDNASFIIDCYMYILFNLNPFFLEQKFHEDIDREYIQILWNCLIPNGFYVYICRNNNFLTLNKLTLKFQNGNEIVNNLILEDANNFSWLKECFKKNVVLFQYVYSTLFPKYFCRIDDYGVKSKLAFEVAHAYYQNQQENLCFVQLQQTLALTVNVKQELIEEEIVNDTFFLLQKSY